MNDHQEDLLTEFDRLLSIFANANFDAGEYVFPRGAGLTEEYNKICDQSDQAKINLRAMYKAALHGDGGRAP